MLLKSDFNTISFNLCFVLMCLSCSVIIIHYMYLPQVGQRFCPLCFGLFFGVFVRVTVRFVVVLTVFVVCVTFAINQLSIIIDCRRIPFGRLCACCGRSCRSAVICRRVLKLCVIPQKSSDYKDIHKQTNDCYQNKHFCLLFHAFQYTQQNHANRIDGFRSISFRFHFYLCL